MLDKMLKNKTRLALKMFIILWFLLFLQVILKLTFNYWQPYVIPTPQLERISDFIDDNLWLKIIIDKIYWLFGTTIVILCGIQQWKFKNKKPYIVIGIVCLISIINYFVKFNIIVETTITLFITLIFPLILNYKKWLWIILTFALNNLFLLISFWLEGFNNGREMRYIIKVLFQNDYYIMLVLNYILFNLIRMKKEENNNG